MTVVSSFSPWFLIKKKKEKEEKREKESWRGMQRQDHGTIVFFFKPKLDHL
jgi:hypothetical protein